MRRGPLILFGLCAVAAAGGGAWYVSRSGDPLAQARTLMQQGDNRGAQLALRDLVRRRPDLAEAHLRLALIQLRLGDPIAAEHELHEAVSHGADEHAIRPLLAQALAGQNQSAVVLRDYDDTGLNPAQSADLHIARSVAAIQLKQVALARTEAMAAMAAAPTSAEAALGLARVGLAAGDLAGAERAVNQTLVLDPHLYAALSLRARILSQQGKAAEAIAAFDAVFADPSSQRVNLAGDRLAQANLYLAKGDDAAARLDVEAALKTASRSPLGNYLLASLEARATHWRAADDAITAVGTALGYFPRADVLLAVIKMNVGQPQQALDAAERFNAHNPKDLAGVRLLAEVDLLAGRAPAVIRLLAPLAVANQSDPAILTMLSQAYTMAGQPADAQVALRQAAAGNRNDPAMMTRIASLAVREGNPGARFGRTADRAQCGPGFGQCGRQPGSRQRAGHAAGARPCRHGGVAGRCLPAGRAGGPGRERACGVAGGQRRCATAGLAHGGGEACPVRPGGCAGRAPTCPGARPGIQPDRG